MGPAVFKHTVAWSSSWCGMRARYSLSLTRILAVGKELMLTADRLTAQFRSVRLFLNEVEV